ncbi:hypothetical protein [Microtetraspora malaysiensis]|uniref:hypothetical protein n=1 Tax=Microtetraspora malaysiensis TaxID=161358 RepID=UPI00082BB89D|nr:hypothetical protein [Microtetraspora malaysiensis]
MRTLLTRTATVVASAMAALALVIPAHAASGPVNAPGGMSGTSSPTAPTPAPSPSAMPSGDGGIPGGLPAICEGQFTDSGHMAGYAICSTNYEWEVGVYCNDGSFSIHYPNSQGVAYFNCYGRGGISRVFSTIWYR